MLRLVGNDCLGLNTNMELELGGVSEFSNIVARLWLEVLHATLLLPSVPKAHVLSGVVLTAYFL